MDRQEADRFRQELALQRLTDAARGMLFGTHRPMNTLAARLLEQPWHRALELGGYSSSRADFLLVDMPGYSVSVYSSFRAVESRMYDKVTVVFEQEPETRQPLHAGFVDTTMRENVSVDVALALLEQFAHGQIRPALAEISVAPQNRHVLVDIRDGWFSAAGFRRAITKINHLTVGENPPVVLRVRVIEHFPLEIGAPFISELERRVSAHGSLRICCNSDGWHAFRALVSSVVPLQNVLRFDTIDQATQDLDRHE